MGHLCSKCRGDEAFKPDALLVDVGLYLMYGFLHEERQPQETAAKEQAAKPKGPAEEKAAHKAEFVGLVERRGQGLLAAQVPAAFQREARHLMVRPGRDNDRQRIALFNERRHIRECADAKLAADLFGALDTGIVKANEPRAGEVAQDSHVVEPESPGANDSDPRGAGVQMMTPRPLSSRKRRK